MDIACSFPIGSLSSQGLVCTLCKFFFNASNQNPMQQPKKIFFFFRLCFQLHLGITTINIHKNSYPYRTRFKHSTVKTWILKEEKTRMVWDSPGHRYQSQSCNTRETLYLWGHYTLHWMINRQYRYWTRIALSAVDHVELY